MPAGAVRTPDQCPVARQPGDTADVVTVLVEPHHAEAMSHRVLRFDAGTSLPRSEARADDLLYATAGAGSVQLGAERHDVVAGSGILVLAGEEWSVSVPAGGGLELASVLVPAPPGPAARAMSRPTGPFVRVATLGGQQRRDASAQRMFEVLFDAERGSRSATQFIGFIPPSGAPEHYHLYDEICLILRGTGVLHCRGAREPIGPGAAFAVTPRLLHSLENTGSDDLWVLGVFRPAGSAAAAYYPDGTPAPGHEED